MNDTKYNGWSNYATWRVNLEVIDGTMFVHEDIASGETELTIGDIACFLKDNVMESVFENIDQKENHNVVLIEGYARAFIDDVNWYEIAQHIVDDNPDILKSY